MPYPQSRVLMLSQALVKAAGMCAEITQRAGFSELAND